MSFGEVAVDFVSGDVKLRKLGNFDDERNEKRGEDSAKLGRYRKSTKMVHTCDKNSSSEPDDDGDIHIQHNQNMASYSLLFFDFSVLRIQLFEFLL